MNNQTAAGAATTKKTTGTKAATKTAGTKAAGTKAAGTKAAGTKATGTKAAGTKAAGTGRGRNSGGAALAGLDKARDHLNGGDGGTEVVENGGNASQDNGAGTEMSQGSGTNSGEMRGGLKQVLIEVVPMGNKGGRSRGTEEYPFSELQPAEVKDGQIVGPSFFIPDSDKPKMKIAVARKRHKPAIFLTRSTTAVIDGEEVTGTRVWRGQPGMK
jgi:hypothetical protein